MGNACDIRMASVATSPPVLPQIKPWKQRNRNCCTTRRYMIPQAQKLNTLLKISSIYLSVIEYFEPIYQHYLLTLPLCQEYRRQTTLISDNWKALLQSSSFEFCLNNSNYHRIKTQFDDENNNNNNNGSSRKGIINNEYYSQIKSKIKSRKIQSTIIQCGNKQSIIQRNLLNNRNHNHHNHKKLYDKWNDIVKPLHLILSKADFTLDGMLLFDGPPITSTDSITIIVNIMKEARSCAILEIRALNILNQLMDHHEHLRNQALCLGIQSLLFNLMLDFPHNELLLSKSLFTTMLLLRPYGGLEGCLFNSNQMNAIKSSALCNNGIKIVLDTMKNNINSRRIQYMGCWALVNIALESEHKKILIKYDAISIVCDVMDKHCEDAKVQFRALFAMINLVTSGDFQHQPQLQHDQHPQRLNDNIGEGGGEGEGEGEGGGGSSWGGSLKFESWNPSCDTSTSGPQTLNGTLSCVTHCGGVLIGAL
mmetsp:Transcript_40135/g.51714  ORF Transcript_40135/g.51714 Transcript_40135/m.51714 type:complete len:479 (-) Transcript_40135:700-2136(-)